MPHHNRSVPDRTLLGWEAGGWSLLERAADFTT